MSFLNFLSHIGHDVEDLFSNNNRNQQDQQRQSFHAPDFLGFLSKGIEAASNPVGAAFSAGEKAVTDLAAKNPETTVSLARQTPVLSDAINFAESDAAKQGDIGAFIRAFTASGLHNSVAGAAERTAAKTAAQITGKPVDLPGAPPQQSFTGEVANAEGPVGKLFSILGIAGDIAGTVPVAQAGSKIAKGVGKELQAGLPIAQNEVGAIGDPNKIKELVDLGKAIGAKPEDINKWIQGAESSATKEPKPTSEFKAAAKDTNKTLDETFGNTNQRDILNQQPLLSEDATRLNVAQKIYGSVTGNIERLAPQAGKEITGLLTKQRDIHDTSLSSWYTDIQPALKLSNDEFDNMISVVEDGAQPTSPAVSQAAEGVVKALGQIKDEAAASKVLKGDLGSTYYPHNYSEAFKDKSFENRTINHLVNTKQAASVEEATNIVRGLREVTRNGRRFGNLELSRNIDLPGYDRTKQGLLDYLQGAAQRISEAKVLGTKDQVINKLITKAGQEGADVGEIGKYVDFALGRNLPPGGAASKVSNAVRTVFAALKLPTAAISNLSQIGNTATVAGTWRTAVATAKKLGRSPQDIKFIEDSAVAADPIIKHIIHEQGFVAKFLGKTVAPGLATVEKNLRGVTALTAREWANSLAAKGDAKSLNILRTKMGVTGDIGKTLTYDQQIQAARRLVERTQFIVDPRDLPIWAHSPLGRLTFQFRSYIYKQTGFMKDEVIGEALKGNVQPLVRFMSVTLPLALATAETKNVIAGREIDSTPKDAFLAALSQSGGLGVPGDIVNNFKYVKDSNGNVDPFNTTRAVASTIAPTAGFGVDLIKQATNVANGKLEPVARFGLKQVPLVGNRLANALTPAATPGGGGSGGSGGSGGGTKTKTKSAPGSIKTAKASRTKSTGGSRRGGGSSRVAKGKKGKVATIKGGTGKVKSAKFKSSKLSKGKLAKVKVAKVGSKKAPKIRKVA